jgi:hypothetical protein
MDDVPLFETPGDDDPYQYPEPPADRQREAWARVEDFDRDRERAIAGGEVR